MPQPILNARALKCIVLDPVEAAQIGAADGKPRVVIGIRLPDRRWILAGFNDTEHIHAFRESASEAGEVSG